MSKLQVTSKSLLNMFVGFPELLLLADARRRAYDVSEESVRVAIGPYVAWVKRNPTPVTVNDVPVAATAYVAGIDVGDVPADFCGVGDSIPAAISVLARDIARQRYGERPKADSDRVVRVGIPGETLMTIRSRRDP